VAPFGLRHFAPKSNLAKSNKVARQRPFTEVRARKPSVSARNSNRVGFYQRFAVQRLASVRPPLWRRNSAHIDAFTTLFSLIKKDLQKPLITAHATTKPG
jgi:hypothetical protein